METKVQTEIHNMTMDWSQQVQQVSKKFSGGLLSFLYQSITKSDELEEFETLSKKYDVNVIAPIQADLINLRCMAMKAEECKRCIEKSNDCYRLDVQVVDGRVKIVRSLCIDTYASKLIRLADVPLKFRNTRLADWTTTDSNISATECAMDSIKSGTGLFISGSAGCGKTMLSSIIINERAYLNKRSHFYTVTDLLEDLRDFDNPVRRAEKLKSVQTTPCLVIDDLGAEFQTEWVASTLFSILDARYKNELMTIINSNFDLNVLAARIKGYHAERIIRRICELCVVTMIT